MNQEQATALGAKIRATREAAGISLRQLAAQLEVNTSWLGYLETGHSLEPAPDRVARIAELLDMDPAGIDRITGNYLAHSLPGVRTYFRSKGKASKAEIDEIERVIAEVQTKYRHGGRLSNGRSTRGQR